MIRFEPLRGRGGRINPDVMLCRVCYALAVFMAVGFANGWFG
jgi:hypothetical protein